MPRSQPQRYFLLSPARLAGVRGQRVTEENAASDLACRLRARGVPLGELFSFVSSLYFRGKLAYATTFAPNPQGACRSFVITGCGGLLPPETVVKLDQLRELYAVDFDPADPRYRDPLHRDAKRLLRSAPDCEVVLLGSIATTKYVDPLIEIFGERLVFPAEFVGRGDMSRGGLMFRAVESGLELTYTPVLSAIRRGRRPPKLTPRARAKI
jgi:hypothetical protein